MRNRTHHSNYNSSLFIARQATKLRSHLSPNARRSLRAIQRQRRHVQNNRHPGDTLLANPRRDRPHQISPISLTRTSTGYNPSLNRRGNIKLRHPTHTPNRNRVLRHHFINQLTTDRLPNNQRITQLISAIKALRRRPAKSRSRFHVKLPREDRRRPSILFLHRRH